MKKQLISLGVISVLLASSVGQQFAFAAEATGTLTTSSESYNSGLSGIVSTVVTAGTSGGGGGSYIVLPTQTSSVVLSGTTNPLTIADQLTNAKYLYVSATKTKVYAKADLTSRVLINLKKNARVTLLKVSGDWVQVKIGNKTGWSVISDFGTKRQIIVRKATTTVKNTTTPTIEENTATPVKIVTKKPAEIIASSLYTNSTRVNIYAAADTKSKFLGYFTKNIKVTVLEENGDWVKVSSATFSGWAKRSLFRSPSEAELKVILRDADKIIPYVLYTNKGRVNVRLAGDKTAKFLGYFGNNTKVEVIGDGSEWINITSKYLTGWSKKEDFREPKSTEDAEVKIAK